MKSLFQALKRWLTVSRVCSWCKHVKHQAIFENPAETTHGICRKCLEVQKAELRHRAAPMSAGRAME